MYIPEDIRQSIEIMRRFFDEYDRKINERMEAALSEVVISIEDAGHKISHIEVDRSLNLDCGEKGYIVTKCGFRFQKPSYEITESRTVISYHTVADYQGRCAGCYA